MPKTVLITGCSTGIGRACAEKFAGEAWNVAATMRSPEKAGSLAGRENVVVSALDVTSESSVNSAVNDALERFGTIDAIVNNAAYAEFGPIEFASDERIARQFSTNVAGPIRLIRAVLPHMRRQRSGVIVNITSGAGRIGFPLSALYCGTKFALEGISEAIQYELQPHGIRVKLVEPGFFKSEFQNNAQFGSGTDSDEYQPLIDAVLNTYQNTQGRYSTPQQIAEVIYEATVDGSPRLRYPAGDDAVQLVAMRDGSSDEAVFDMIRTMYPNG